MSILYFTADWCGPCKTFGPLVEKVSNELNIDIEKININNEEKKEIVAQHNVMAVPTLLVLDPNGNERGRSIGSMNEKELREFFGEKKVT